VIVEFWSEPLRTEAKAMVGPGAYRPDPSAGIPALADVPQPEMVPYRRHAKRHVCPRGGPVAERDTQSPRTRHAWGHRDAWGPRALRVTSAPPDCTPWRQDGNAALSALAPPGSRDPHRVSELAVRLVVADGVPYRPARGHLWREHRVLVPCATIQNGGEAGEKRRRRAWTRTCLTG
jgi:hypothetical protein